MDWPIAFRCGERFGLILDSMKLLAFVANVILRQDTPNSLIASISFYDCLKGSVEQCEDGS